MPRIERQPPPYMQITDHFRRQIVDGELAEGDRLPSVAKVAKDWNVAHATAARAISQLQVEGLITTSPSRGSFVAAQNNKANSPSDRIARSHRAGTTAATNEHHQVRIAEVTKAPAYVADLFDIEPGSPVVRREWVTIDNGQIRSLNVTWHPGELAEQVPQLLEHDSSGVGSILSRVEEVYGKANRGRDYYHGRGSDARESSALGVAVGTAILAMTWLYWAPDGDNDRLIEYGESCLPPRHTVSYPYDISDNGE